MLLLQRQLRPPVHTLEPHLNQTPVRLGPRLLSPLHRNLLRLIHPGDTRPYTVTEQRVFGVLHDFVRILAKTDFHTPLTPNLHLININKRGKHVGELALKRFRKREFFGHYFSANLFLLGRSFDCFQFYGGRFFRFRRRSGFCGATVRSKKNSAKKNIFRPKNFLF